MTLLLLTLPGSAKNYYGDEIGMTDLNGTQGAYQGPMQWSDGPLAGFSDSKSLATEVGSDYKTNRVNVNAQLYEAYSPLQLFKRIALMYSTNDAFLYGGIQLGKRNESGLWLLRNQTHGLNYLAILNFDNQKMIFNATEGLGNMLPAKASVVEMTSNLDIRQVYKPRQDLKVDQVELDAREGILLKFKNE